MKDKSKEGLLNKNIKNKKNSMISFESISEKQEESSNSSIKNTKIIKKKLTIKKNFRNSRTILKPNEIPKDIIDLNNLALLTAKRHTANYFVSSTKIKKLSENFKEEDDKDNKEKNFLRQSKKRESKKKKSGLFSSKRISFQQDNFHFLTNQQIKTEEALIKRSSSKNMESSNISNINNLNNMNKTVLRKKRSNNKIVNLLSVQKANSITDKSLLRNRSENFSNSEFLDMKYFSHKKVRNTVLHKGKLNLKDQRNTHSSNLLFERLKDSYLFEKSEAVLFKIKICYGFLAVFSFISILLQTIDVILFNKYSEEFLEKNYNISVLNETNIDNYHFIENRKISNRENTIRIFNLTFSILCFFLHLIIHFIKNNFDKQFDKKKKKKNYYYNYNKRKRKASTLGIKDNNINENHIKLVGNDDFFTKNFVTRGEIIKLVINCIISLFFYPPGLNKVFIGMNHSIIYVYSLNSFFLLITFFKIANIYYAIYYLSPFNNLLYRTICTSNMVKLNFRFMFRLLVNLYPMPSILINFIVIAIIISILLYCIEYFSINVLKGNYNNKGENDLKNFYNEIYLFCYFTIKNIYGNIKTETTIGDFILIIGGNIGLLILTYFIYYINQLIEFKPDEQQAYSKLVKLLNPINNEHKASNLIKVFILLKKNYIDNPNIEEEYKLKKESNFKKMIQRNLGLRRSNFNFAVNDSSNSLINFGYNSEYKEKMKFLNYLTTSFILKAKLINEIKNFKNNLLIARNNSLSFNDVLKTLGDKLNGNMTQLNNKLEVLIKYDQKYKNFMKLQVNSIKKLKKVLEYQEYVINYLINKNNEENIDYLNDNKENQNNFINKYKNAPKGGGARRMKSTVNGTFFAFSKRPRKKSYADDDKITKNDSKKNNLFDAPKKFGFKRLKSSILGKKTDFNSNDISRSKTNPIKRFSIGKIKTKPKSLDDKIMKEFKKRKKINKIESNIIENLRRITRSLSGKKKEVIDKWKNKIENKNNFVK